MTHLPPSTTAHLTRRRAAAGAAAVLTLLLGATACGGGDDNDAPGAQGAQGQSGQPSAGASGSDQTTVGSPVNGCQAKVTVTGAATATWKGKAQVVLRGANDSGDGPNAVYSGSTKGGNSIAVYSKGPGWEPSVTLSVAGDNFTTQPDHLDGLDASEKGDQASVDTDVVDVDNKTAHVQANVTCSDQAVSTAKKHHKKPDTKHGKGDNKG